MARKSVLKTFDMVADGNDMSENITSSIVNVENLDKASIHVSWAGSSPVGPITIEARNGADDTWYTLDFGAAISVSGNSGDHQIQFTELFFTDIRLQYADGGGTGTMTARITAKATGS